MRIDLLTENRWGFSYENYAAYQVKKGLEKCGVDVCHLSLEDGKFYQECQHIVLTFERLEVQGDPLAQFLNCPKFHWESRWLSKNALKQDSAYTHIGYFDPGVEIPKVTFLPHAVSTDLKQEKERPFDLISFIDVIDPRNQQESWGLMMDEKAMAPLFNPALEDPRSLRESDAKTKLEWELVNSLTLPVHLFGKHIGKHLLLRLPKQLYLHNTLTYISALRTLSKTKILLSHQHTQGVDQWFLPALFSGCLVISNETPYLREIVGNQFKIFYPTQNWNAMEACARTFLENPKLREEIVYALQEKLRPLHNWDVRAEQLLAYLETL